MAFQNKNLSVMAYANGFTLWHYNDKSTKFEDVNLDNYFNPISDLVAIGDKFMLNFNGVYAEAVVNNIINRTVSCKLVIKVDLN